MKKVYANYITLFDHLTRVLLEHSSKKKSALILFLEVNRPCKEILLKSHKLFLQDKATSGALDLKAYLIMPVQRLPRYEILLAVQFITQHVM